MLQRSLAAGALLTFACAATAAEQLDVQLPRQIAWTAYETGSAGHSQAVAIGAALKNALGVDLRVLPGRNDVSRMVPLREGRVHFAATGIGAFMAQEAVFEFADPSWGPQPIRMLIANSGSAVNIALGVAGDLGVQSYADLAGKRVAWVQGAPAINIATEAYLACGGLAWDDVVRVDFGGFADSYAGLVNGQVDAALAPTNSGMAYEAASAPRGLSWPPIPPDDGRCLERMQAVAPYFRPNVATVGAGIDGDEPVPGATYAYPILITNDRQDPDLVYNMTKALAKLFDSYKDAAPGINGWAVENQDFQWVIPYHKGAVRYYREIGRWSDEAQQHNDRLIERQEALLSAWRALEGEEAGSQEWEEHWSQRRRQALNDGGFDVAF
jgi:uncharacterized protein